jgi:hypothetical protein
MKLIDDWKQSWKFLSVRIQAVASMALIVFLALPKDQQELLLTFLPLGDRDGAAVLALVTFLIAIWARVTAQPELHQKE